MGNRRNWSFISKKLGSNTFNNNGKRSKINYPNLLFSFAIDTSHQVVTSKLVVLKDKDVISVKLFGTESYSIRPKAKGYQYDLGNVASSGTICWGGNALPQIKSYKNLAEIVNLFFESPTNQHYTRRNFNTLSSKCAMLKILENYEFNEKDLSVVGNY